MSQNSGSIQTAVFGGGCFWCTEAIFAMTKGVISVVPGYSGGKVVNPSYEQVSEGNTGHVECAKIQFDSNIISYQNLLKVFFETHDPTQVNSQGNDIGSQYQSTIFYLDQNQKDLAEKFIAKLDEEKVFNKKVATEVRHMQEFYPAEDYHYKYYESHKGVPYCELVIEPKLEKLKNIKFD